MSTKQFSSDLSTQILNKEFELESSPCFSTLQELIDLYSTAIEHYALLNDSKYQSFKNRMHSMLSRPEIVRIMQSESTPVKALRSRKQSSSVVEKKSNRLIRTHDTLNERSVVNTKRELQVQDLTLKRKLALRIHSSPRSFQNCETPELQFEEKIEAIMERNFAEKAERVAEVKVKYTAHLQEIQEQGNLGSLISQQMKLNMEEEIKQISREIDEKRKTEISLLKEMFNS